MSAQPAPFAHIHQTSFNVEAIDRRAISHIASLQGHKRRSRQVRAESGLSQTRLSVLSRALADLPRARRRRRSRTLPGKRSATVPAGRCGSSLISGTHKNSKK